MIEKEVIVVGCESGDWSGLYVDGELEYEGHSIYERDWIDLIKKHKYFKQLDSFTVADGYLENRGNLPKKFIDIPNVEFI